MEWRRGQIIGRGSTATVSLATTVTGDLFAVKSTELSCSGFLQREQHFLSQLNSPRVIEYMGFEVDYTGIKPMYNLFMEYAPGGTISDVIKKQGGSLDESLIRSYAHQILQGLDYLHSNNLVHCDIKGQNVLVGKDGVKIGDLGCAKLVEHGGISTATSAFSGTPVFMAPEVTRGEEQGFPADMWALGCTIIEMATGANPWPELNDPVSALYRIGYSSDVPEFPRCLSEEGKDFLDKCLRRDAEERWTAKELLQHPFVNNSNSGSEKLEEFTRKSPTSTLDPGFWDSLEEESAASAAPTLTVNLSGDSPVERIRQLISEAATPATSHLPNWADEDEDWVTVRISQIDEPEKISERSLDTDLDDGGVSTSTESFLHWDFYVEEEQLESSVSDEDLVMLECVVIATSSESVTNVSRVLDCGNKINDNYLPIDSNLSFAVLPFSISFGQFSFFQKNCSDKIWV